MHLYSLLVRIRIRIRHSQNLTVPDPHWFGSLDPDQCGFSADPDSAFNLNADQDPGRQTNADPHPGQKTYVNAVLQIRIRDPVLF